MGFNDWAEEYDKKEKMREDEDAESVGIKGGRSEATQENTDDTDVTGLYDDEMEDGV